jgi:2-hydroxychromene-2-carboxylate isomerase
MPAPDAAFYFDLASPEAYLAAERILHVLGAPAEWQPVLARELRAPATESLAGEGSEVWRCEHERDAFCEDVARRAHAQDLQPLAMRVATYAKSIGRTVPFAQAAFRQAFAGGRNLAEMDNVLIAAAACEMHPAAVSNAAELRSVAEQLATTTALAAQAGVTGVPAVRVGERVWTGERAVEDAAAHMRADRVAGALP